jgi:hypothetical protein
VNDHPTLIDDVRAVWQPSVGAADRIRHIIEHDLGGDVKLVAGLFRQRLPLFGRLGLLYISEPRLAGMRLALVQNDEQDVLLELLTDSLDVDSLSTEWGSSVGAEFDDDRPVGVGLAERERLAVQRLEREVRRDIAHQWICHRELVEPAAL